MTATEGPIAVITGAGSDIGPATAQLFLERGYSIVPRFYRRVPSNG
jgi:NADP-dependent 3-hydroxy acid dehydrogenase YdfG